MSHPSNSNTSATTNHYLTNPHRRNLLGHISIGAQSYTVAKAFYTSILSALSVTLIYDNPTKGVLGYGFPTHPNQEIINVFERGEEARAPGAGSHIALNAENRQAVIEFWKAGIANGGRDDGEPGVRGAYGKGYFAAYLVDPDGWRVEAVCHEDNENNCD